jgi:asparagine synthase (glutamine-hydrolysing)
MCGIAGILSSSNPDVGTLASMADALVHRGPDGEGFLTSDLRSPLELTRRPRPLTGSHRAVGLAHRRLAIIDLSSTNDQPFIDERAEHAVVHNGEIYNYPELRSELERCGHRFRTTGDTEVVLRAYIEWGPSCFERFIGMWAIAILDLREGQLTLSRDRFGVKPLYWTVAGEHMLFASEIKALLASGLVRAEPNEQTMARYLISARIDVDESTFFAGIHQLPAASIAVIPLDGTLMPSPRPYWSLPEPGSSTELNEAAIKVREGLESSLRLHLRSDVAVGTCLSGGIDSSGIVAVADSLRGAGVDETFTHAAFGYVPPERELSERRYMDAVAERYGIALTCVEPTRDEFISALPEVIATQDEPFGSASIAAQWFVFRAARKAGIKVMLDGQGADEVFGGYHSYLALIAQDHLLGGRPLAFVRFTGACRTSVGHRPFPLLFTLGAALPRGPRMLAARAVLEFQDRRAQTRALSAPHIAPALHALLPERGRPTQLDVEELLRAELQTQSLPALLRYEDRNSMAHSIEARVPYLDHRLVELASRMPVTQRMHNATPKHVLRQALDDVLPAIILQRRDKIGFRASPSATWEFARRHRESLIEAHSRPEDAWFAPAEIARLIDSPVESADTEFALWRAINAKLWARRLWGEPFGSA